MRGESLQLSDLLVSSRSSVRECLTIVEKVGVGSVFVVDGDARLVGVVGASDIHRALIAGAGLDDSVQDIVSRPVSTVAPSCGRADALDLMDMLRITEVAVVDDDGRVVGAHVSDQVMGVEPRENWAVVMAGGRGSRLSPLTDNIPKPMLPVAGRPILERLVLHLVGSGIRRVFLSVNYLGSMIEQHFGDGSAFGCTIEYLWEDPDQPLGTGGSLAILENRGLRPTAPLLVMNGDLVTGFPVGEMLDSHVDSGVVATIATSKYEHQVPFGVLEASADRLERIVEKPTTSWPVNAGIYVLEPSLLARVPWGQMFPITRLFDGCLSRGEPIGLWAIPDQWQDIGRPQELAHARGQQ